MRSSTVSRLGHSPRMSAMGTRKPPDGSTAGPAGTAAEAPTPPAPDESTVELLMRARTGDRSALERVFARNLPPLRRWASGRLPRWARAIVDTDDLVQETLIRTLQRIDVFEYRADGALQAYLRQAVMNHIRNEIRDVKRHPRAESLDSNAAEDALSPLESLLGKETVDAYEAALSRLSESEREAVIGRVELGLSYDELAAAMGRPSPDAARMAVGRALLKLARLLRPEASR